MVCKKQQRPKVGETSRVARRKGVYWRNNPRKCVVEMRLPKPFADLRLHFGSYDTEDDAMIARDYGAYVRDAAGKEDRATVGGYLDNHPSIFEFGECLEIFESLEASKARCDEYKSLLAHWTKDGHEKFCDQARKDIFAVIQVFRRRDPQMFVNSRLVKAEPLDGETRVSSPSSSEVRVSSNPTACDGNAGDLYFRTVDFAMAVDGSPFKTVLHVKVPRLDEEQISTTVKDFCDRIYRELIDKLLEVSEPCSVDPSTIPLLDPGT